MRISIDTATDSHEHIRKVIDLLRNLVGESSGSGGSSSSNIFDNPAPAAPFAGIFGDAPAAPAPAPSSEPSSPPAVEILKDLNAPKTPQAVDLWGNPKDPDKDPPVEVY